MAATFTFGEDNGAQTGSPTKGATRTDPRAEVNWKNVDDSTTAYSTSPITAGNNSYDKWQFGHFVGAYNSIANGLFAHTAGTLGTGLTLVGTVIPPSGAYTTPATTANTALAWDISAVLAITSGSAVFFGATGPEVVSKAASTTANPAYTQWLATQLRTTTAAAAGDTNTVTLTLRYDEN